MIKIVAAEKKARREEKQREIEERAKMLRKEHLMREIELGALNTKRYRTLWREMMMRIKMPLIVEDMEIAWRNFDRAVDIKDYRISFLMDALDEAEEQYQRNVRSHMEIIDQLLETYRKRMQHKERNYQKILFETVNQADTEVGKIDRQWNEDEILIESIIRGIERQHDDSLDNIKSITLSKIDAFMQDSKDVYRISAGQLENQLRNSWDNLRQVLSDYHNKTMNRRKRYKAIKEKDEKDQQVIAQQLTRTANLFDEIRKLRGKITMYDVTAKKDISEILMEHNFFQNAYSTMKNRLLSEQTKDQDQLKILTIEYNKAIKHLKRLVTKGQQLLTLMQICRKYETQEEKVIPFVYCTEIENSLTPSSQQVSVPSDFNMIHQIMEDYQDLTNFWRRVGAVQVITMQLRSERNKLKSEANRLRECLHSYMTQKVRGKSGVKYKII
ncbi:dynein regulatory complex subunit 2-like [Odontomachus brunneus]|uniref:dynein regulatory complex subunit 2-like n=1 Tax=Odontomachus brunneus TaxID=486640 RepID=UPI0013F2A163|nr:dynein regulatory complex subunit 2-like [Odontomachus brunneus]